MKRFSFINLTNSANAAIVKIVNDLTVTAANENQAFVEASKKAIRVSGYIHLHECTAHIKKHFAAY